VPTSAPTEIDAVTVIDWMSDPDAVTVLDVRSPAEFETTHIAGSYLPLDLVGAGMRNLHVLKAGQIVRGRPRWALERQVRLVAGGLILAGVIASHWTPRSVLLVGGVGAGLTVSALTDTCTLGRLLSALAYNRGAQADAAQLLEQLPTPDRVLV
jgi:rhodanese-related sulfurtransferase